MPRSDGISTIRLLDAADVETASAHADHVLPACIAQPTEDDPAADDVTSVWAESIRLAVDAQPAALCTRGLAVAGLLQVAFTASIAGSFAVTDDATRNNLFLAAGLLAFLMVIEICASPSATYIQNVLQDDSAYQHVENVRKAAPSIRWHIQCYHYRTEAYITTQMDGAGNKQIQNHNRQVRHNTHSAWAIYTPYYWEDISSPFPDIGSASLTRLTFEREFVFADDESRSHFRSAKQQFIHANRKDAHYDFAEVLDTPGFQRKVLACKDSAEVPWWLNSWCYYIASALCLTIPFRLFFAWKCCEIPEYRYIKRFYSHPIAVIACPVPVVTGCTATMPDTAELLHGTVESSYGESPNADAAEEVLVAQPSAGWEPTVAATAHVSLALDSDDDAPPAWQQQS